MLWMEKILFGLILLYWSREDIRFHSLVSWQLILSCAGILFLNLVDGGMLLDELLVAAAWGAGALFVGKLTGGGIGRGDAWVMGSIGILMGGRKCTMIIIGAIGLAGLYAAYLLLVKKRNRKTEIPLIPFLTLVYLLCLGEELLALLP